MSDSLHHAVRQNSRAVLIIQGASQIVSLVVLAILYRKLGPDPYGLFNMVWPLLVFSRIVVASGLDMVTVQHRDLDDRQISALFWVNQGLGIFVTLITAACAPLLAWFYGVEELGWVTVGAAGTSFAFVLGIQHQAVLQRRMRLTALWASRVTALGLAGVTAVVMAVQGYGVWALIAQQYVELLLLALFVWCLEPWRPKLALLGVGARRLVRLGGHFTVSHLTLYVMMYVDKILVGRFADGSSHATEAIDATAVRGNVHSVGIYSQAYALAMKPVNVFITPLTGIMLPALAKARGDQARYETFLLGFFRFLFLVLLPVGAGFAVTASEVITILGGEKWHEATPLLAVFGFAIPVQACYQSLAYVFASVGAGRRLSRVSLVNAVVLVATYACGFWIGKAYGDPLFGTALGYTLGLGLIVLPYYLTATLRAVGVPVRRFAAEIVPLVVATAAMVVVVAATRFALTRCVALPVVGLLTIEVAVGAIVYAGLTYRVIFAFLRAGLRPKSTPADSADAS